MVKSQKIILFIITLISIILISTLFFLNRTLEHKKEIDNLLKKEDITQINSNQQYLLINEYDDENINTKGKDFITDIENEQQGDEQSKKTQRMERTDNTDDDVMLLAKLINSEAGNEPFEGKVAVANVVLYRSQREKESIREIIYARGQFDGVDTNLFMNTPNSESIEAAQRAVNGEKVLDNAYYYANLNLCSPSWATEKRFLCRIGDHWFFKQ